MDTRGETKKCENERDDLIVSTEQLVSKVRFYAAVSRKICMESRGGVPISLCSPLQSILSPKGEEEEKEEGKRYFLSAVERRSFSLRIKSGRWRHSVASRSGGGAC